jgi:4-carboxymuconolactone decarboxylase
VDVTDPKNPFEDMMAMGQAWMKAMGPAMEAFAPDKIAAMFPTMPREMMETFMGKGISPEGLDAKSRLLLTLNGLTIQGAHAEPQITLTVRHAVEAGATPQEIAETIALAGLFGGTPAMAKAMQLAQAVLDSNAEGAE